MVGRRRRLARTDRDRAVLARPRQPEGRWPETADRLAVGPDHLDDALDETLRGGDAGNGPHLVDELLGEGHLRRGVDGRRSPLEVAELRDRVDVDVDPGRHRREQVVERGVDGVGEHERAGDERHAEHDREQRQREARDVAGDGFRSDPKHRQSSSCLMRSRTPSASAPTSSSTMRPSWRNSTRSA